MEKIDPGLEARLKEMERAAEKMAEIKKTHLTWGVDADPEIVGRLLSRSENETLKRWLKPEVIEDDDEEEGQSVKFNLNLGVVESSMDVLIDEVCGRVSHMLKEKNKAYGDSVGNPISIFATGDPVSQINVRIDDKLSRIARGHKYQDEDTEMDLIGYLVLKRCLKIREETRE